MEQCTPITTTNNIQDTIVAICRTLESMTTKWKTDKDTVTTKWKKWRCNIEPETVLRTTTCMAEAPFLISYVALPFILAAN